MLGFGALGEFALGEGPFAQTRPVGSQWAMPVRKTGLAVAIVAGSFTGFVPQPPAQAAPVFSQFSQPQTSRVNLPDEQPSALFEALPPSQPTPVFAPFDAPRPAKAKQQTEGFSNAPQAAFVQPYVFSTFSVPQINAKARIATYQTSFTNAPVLPPVIDTHDLALPDDYFRKKRKRTDPLNVQLEERSKRRSALRDALNEHRKTLYDRLYPTSAELYARLHPAPDAAPQTIQPPEQFPVPDVTDLARVVSEVRLAQMERTRAQELQDDEDDIEAILKDIL